MERLTILTESARATSVKTPNQTKSQKRHLVRFDRPGERDKRTKALGNNPQPVTDLRDWLATRMTS